MFIAQFKSTYSKVRRFKIEKLVRDKIPEKLQMQGCEVSMHSLGPDLALHHLKLKLKEEAEEVFTAPSLEHLEEEMGDVLEVLYALAERSGFDLKNIEQKRLSKREKNGGFEKRIFVDFIDIESSDNQHPVLQYYLKRSQNYPEIFTSLHSSSIADDENCQ